MTLFILGCIVGYIIAVLYTRYKMSVFLADVPPDKDGWRDVKMRPTHNNDKNDTVRL